MKTYTYYNHTNLKRFIIRDREAGNYLGADFDTPNEALAQIRKWEADDETNGYNEPTSELNRYLGFYEVFDLETEAIM